MSPIGQDNCRRTKEVVTKASIILSAPGTELDGESRTLSIPPSGTSLFTAHLKKLQRLGIVQTAITLCSAGEKVKHGTAPAYYPWNFSLTVTA